MSGEIFNWSALPYECKMHCLNFFSFTSKHMLKQCSKVDAALVKKHKSFTKNLKIDFDKKSCFVFAEDCVRISVEDHALGAKVYSYRNAAHNYAEPDQDNNYVTYYMRKEAPQNVTQKIIQTIFLDALFRTEKLTVTFSGQILLENLHGSLEASEVYFICDSFTHLYPMISFCNAISPNVDLLNISRSARARVSVSRLPLIDTAKKIIVDEEDYDRNDDLCY